MIEYLLKIDDEITHLVDKTAVDEMTVDAMTWRQIFDFLAFLKFLSCENGIEGRKCIIPFHQGQNEIFGDI
jgi:hypothetical protein